MELVRADIVARWKQSQGFDVFFNTGTDEHGQKLFDSARKAKKDITLYVDEYAQAFQRLAPVLGISSDIHHIRTTDKHHEVAAQAFWNRVYERGYIYKKTYRAKYCVGCEENKADSDLINGHCELHQNLSIEIIEEENYFFKFSEFGERLLSLYEEAEKEGRSFVVPNFRLNEMKEFVKRGLEDFSISRLASKMSWGIPVPHDQDHVMYVWFDALTSYISTLGWPEDNNQFEKYWVHGTPVQYCGKDNTRFQSVMWQAMLMAAELPPSHTIVVNGFLTSGGQKMSKSLGNVISPFDVVNEFGVDAFRYFVAGELNQFEDSDFTIERFKEAYNANLANGLGNLVSRIMKMAHDNLKGPIEIPQFTQSIDFATHINNFEINKATTLIWQHVSALDVLIQTETPFKLVKTDIDAGRKIISHLVIELYRIAEMLESILPDTALAIKQVIQENKSPEKPLFLRKD